MLYCRIPPMSSPETTPTPEDIYKERCARFARERDAYAARWERAANGRLFAFVGAVACFVWAWWQNMPPVAGVGALFVAAFVALVIYHNKLGRARRRYDELWRISDEAQKRLGRRWNELPLRHTVRAEPASPYAADLDLFGHASLTQLLETFTTRTGEDTLASWLLAPAPPQTVRARQGAVAELAPMIDLRDELTLRGRLRGDGGEARPDPEPFLKWTESRPYLARRPWLPWVAIASVLLLWVSIILQVVGIVPTHLWFFFAAANFTWTMTGGREIYSVLMRASGGEAAFRQYAEQMQLISEAPFRSPKLKELQATLTVDGVEAHHAMRRMGRLTNLVIPRSAQLYTVIEALTMWDVHLLGAFERWQGHAAGRARGWIGALGEAEALAALAVLAHDNPGWTFPDLDPQADSLVARDLGHPLLPAEAMVTNNVEVGPPGTFLLVTGSNMSGKSTLLRSIGINIVLAQAGAPVCASEMRLPPLTLWTSVRVQDSLERGVSFFMAELQRLKQVVDAARQAEAEAEGTERKLFYLLDEILQGTNTTERQIAARRVIMYLVEHGGLGAVSTHDLALAEGGKMERAARPVHFTETILNGVKGMEMRFDYKLRPGLATSTNALQLMEIVGLALDE